MIDVIESLLKGENEYPAAFKAAKLFWDQFFEEHANDDAAELRKAIGDAQHPFTIKMEKEAGLVYPSAKAIMSVTCIGSLYNDGFDDADLAKRTVKAFENNDMLSLGIGSSAKEVAAMYGLKD